MYMSIIIVPFVLTNVATIIVNRTFLTPLLVFLVLFGERFLSRDGAVVLLKFMNILLSFVTYGRLRNVVPHSLATLRKKSGMDKLLEDGKAYVVCPSCHCVYRDGEVGHNQYLCDYRDLQNDLPCDTPLFLNVRGRIIPPKVFAYHPIASSIKRLMSRPDFAEDVEHWRACRNDTDTMYDVYDGDMWWNLSINIDNQRIPFVELRYALMLTLNVDWFQAFDRKAPYSVGAMYLTINNLPRSIRFKKENVILAGIIPGPREPVKNQLNQYLRYVIITMLLEDT